MGQQNPLAAFVARLAAGGLGPLNLDGAGNLKVITAGGGGDSVTLAAGAVAAGAYVAGALVDGADVTQGTIEDAAWSGTGNATVVAALKAIAESVAKKASSYVACPASATTALGGAGAIGDVLHALTITPLTTSPGEVQIKDGAGDAIDVFLGGATSVVALDSWTLLFDAPSAAGGWEVICGANVSAVASGQFA